jgi:hypothetical protein
MCVCVCVCVCVRARVCVRACVCAAAVDVAAPAARVRLQEGSSLAGWQQRRGGCTHVRMQAWLGW